MLPTILEDKDISSTLIGIDEAGRGCLCGVVCAAAVIWDPQFEPSNSEEEKLLQLIKDSKKLSVKQRDKLEIFIKKNAKEYAIGTIDNHEIDNINILQATFKAMHKALDNVSTKYDKIYVDGNRFKPYLNNDGEFVSHTCVVDGDNKLLQIAAASILAKTHRDKIMVDLHNSDERLQVYGWNKNKGYGTKQHMDAIKKYGITDYHRKTFIKI